MKLHSSRGERGFDRGRGLTRLLHSSSGALLFACLTACKDCTLRETGFLKIHHCLSTAHFGDSLPQKAMVYLLQTIKWRCSQVLKSDWSKKMLWWRDCSGILRHEYPCMSAKHGCCSKATLKCRACAAWKSKKKRLWLSKWIGPRHEHWQLLMTSVVERCARFTLCLPISVHNIFASSHYTLQGMKCGWNLGHLEALNWKSMIEKCW